MHTVSHMKVNVFYLSKYDTVVNEAPATLHFIAVFLKLQLGSALVSLLNENISSMFIKYSSENTLFNIIICPILAYEADSLHLR